MINWFNTIASLFIFPLCCAVCLILGIIDLIITRHKKSPLEDNMRKLTLDTDYYEE